MAPIANRRAGFHPAPQGGEAATMAGLGIREHHASAGVTTRVAGREETQA